MPLTDALRGAWNVLTFRNLPYAQIERRDALGQMPVQWQIGKPVYPDRDPATYDRDAYRKLAIVFACVNELAFAVAQAPIRTYTYQDNQKTELPTHGIRRLMKRPNPMMGEARFLSYMTMQMATSGFIVLEKIRSGAGTPVQLWALRSDWLYPIPRSNAAPDWEYRIPGFDARRSISQTQWDGPLSQNGYPVIAADNAIAVTWADTPDGSPLGVGPLEVAIPEWGLMRTMQDYLKAFFDQGAMPTYGLVLADNVQHMNQEKANLISELWEGQYSGWRNGRTKVPILHTIKDVKRLSFDFNELAYKDLRDVSELAICQAFGVPGMVIGQRFAQEKSTYSNYEEANQAFYERTVKRLWDRLDDALTLGLLPDFVDNPRQSDIFLEFDTSNIAAFQEDIVAKRDHYLRALQAGGITRAQYKQAIGLPIEEKADNVYLMPFNVVEVPAGTNAPQRGTQRVTGASVTVREDGNRWTGGTLAITSGVSGSFDRRGQVVPEVRERLQTRAVAHYNATARMFSPKLMLFFRAQGRRVVAALNERSAAGAPETRDVADVLTALDWDYEDAELRAVLEQLWNLMGATATDDVSGLLGLSEGALTWDLANPWVQGVMEQLAGRVTGINETTRDQIRTIVTDALNEGVSIPELADKLRGTFEETYRGRSETIARTESMNAYVNAQIASYQEGGVSEVECLDNSSHTDDRATTGDFLTCAERNGTISPITEAHKHLAGEHINGSLSLAPIVRLGEV